MEQVKTAIAMEDVYGETVFPGIQPALDADFGGIASHVDHPRRNAVERMTNFRQIAIPGVSHEFIEPRIEPSQEGTRQGFAFRAERETHVPAILRIDGSVKQLQAHQTIDGLARSSRANSKISRHFRYVSDRSRGENFKQSPL